jgi:predicted ATPase
LNVLTRGVSTSARQQTLRATIESSFDLLRPEEQAVFRVTGVFSDGATLEAIEAVIASMHRDGASAGAALDVVESLLDQHLLEIDRSSRSADVPRVRMLETIREFALDSLASRQELDIARRSHAG